MSGAGNTGTTLDLEIAHAILQDMELVDGAPILSEGKLTEWAQRLRSAGDNKIASTQLIALALRMQEQWPDACDNAVDQLMALAIVPGLTKQQVDADFGAAGVDVKRVAATTGSQFSKQPITRQPGGTNAMDIRLGGDKK